MCEKLCDLSIERLLYREVSGVVTLLYQLLDLMLQYLGSRLRFLAFRYLILVVHRSTLLQKPNLKRKDGLFAGVGDYLDLDVKCARVVVEVSFVDAEEQCAVAGGGEFAGRSDVDKIVVVVTDDGDERTGRDIL